MAAQCARKIDDPTGHERVESPLPVGAGFKRRRADSSAVAAMQRRIETAALQGFFEKTATPRWRGGGSRAALVVAAAGGIWMVILAIVSAGMN